MNTLRTIVIILYLFKRAEKMLHALVKIKHREIKYIGHFYASMPFAIKKTTVLINFIA